MWSTLQTVLRPASLDEALELGVRPGHGFAGGGSYLADERPAHLHTLVALTPLIDSRVRHQPPGLKAGSGVSLEALRQAALAEGPLALAEALAADTPEPNLRHQRLLGGALVHGRNQSPLAALCLAADARLERQGQQGTLPFVEWDGTGLVTGLHLTTHGLAFAGLSLLPASRPCVFVACGHHRGIVNVAAGASGCPLTHLALAETDARPLPALAPKLAVSFVDDSLGSIAWKTRALAALLEDLEARSWK